MSQLRRRPAGAADAPQLSDAFWEELDAWARERGPTPVRHDYGPLPDQHAMAYGDGPTAIVIHGGFWRAQYREPIMAAFCVALAQLGLRAWSIEYRRVGTGGGYPHTLDDVAAAIQAAPEPCVAVGHSAGGHLALWAAAEGLVPAAVSLAGVCDLVAGARDNLGNGAVRDFDPALHADADPAQRLPIDAELVLVHGVDDEIVPVAQSRSFAARSGAELIELPGVGHFEVIDPRAAAFLQIAERMRQFAA
jgi:acetyl esterase/lipase